MVDAKMREFAERQFEEERRIVANSVRSLRYCKTVDDERRIKRVIADRAREALVWDVRRVAINFLIRMGRERARDGFAEKAKMFIETLSVDELVRYAEAIARKESVLVIGDDGVLRFFEKVVAEV